MKDEPKPRLVSFGWEQKFMLGGLLYSGDRLGEKKIVSQAMSTIMSSFPKSYRVSEGEIVAGGTVAETSKESK